MKKFLIILLILVSIFITGCGKNDQKSIIKKFEKKVNGTDSYHIVGILDITNNDETYSYDVDVSYKKDDNYRVSLINKSNGHEQIILKNNTGVYVVTPSLNKSFKFQSDWPNNNSQVYLLRSILEDITKDKNRTFEQKDGLYVFTTTVNYPNNPKLVKQNIKLDKNYIIKEIEIVDEAGIPQMIMKFNEVDLKADFDDKHFELDKIVDDNNGNEDGKNNEDLNKGNTNQSDGTQNDSDTNTTSSINDVVFPLYIPTGTTLTDQEKVSKTDGERVILTFDGEKPFLLVEETANVEKNFSVVPTYGEPFLMANTVAALTSNSLTWVSNGVEYYLVSDAISQLELVEIANSISSIPTMK